MDLLDLLGAIDSYRNAPVGREWSSAKRYIEMANESEYYLKHGHSSPEVEKRTKKYENFPTATSSDQTLDYSKNYSQFKSEKKEDKKKFKFWEIVSFVVCAILFLISGCLFLPICFGVFCDNLNPLFLVANFIVLVFSASYFLCK